MLEKKSSIEMYLCVVLKTTLLQILSFHYTSVCFDYFRCFYKTIVFRLMNDVALIPCWNGLDSEKIEFDPQKIGVKGSMTPKFQSLNRALLSVNNLTLQVRRDYLDLVEFKAIVFWKLKIFQLKWKQLTLSSIYTHFNTLEKKALGKHSGKRWNFSN